jgi:hypothetical protein
MINNNVGNYNVIKEYDWTSVPRGAVLRNEAPKVMLRSYKVNSNLVINRLTSYLEVAETKDPETFYNDLYANATTPEDNFYFPYFSDSARNFNNQFGDTFQNGFGGSGGIGETADSIAQKYIGGVSQIRSALGDNTISNVGTSLGSGDISGAKDALMAGIKSGGSPGSYIETPKMYDYSSANEGSLDISFVLSNTLNTDFNKNYELVKKLIQINRPKRNDSISMDPPRIYKAKLYGYRYMPWAYCSNFSINLLGTKRMLNGVITPEAYQINMSLQPLTAEPSNFMDNVT